MRALLVVNPAATSTSPRQRDVLSRALKTELKVEVAETTHRGHATALARQAVVDGLDLVVVLGGDGTVNEVVNGLLGEGPVPGLPSLAVVPGGSTNVLARAAGVPREPLEATGALLDAVGHGRTRPLSVGRADSRWFTFCAGVGLDAEVIAAVERQRAFGHPATSSRYVRTAVRRFFLGTDRRTPSLTVERPGAPGVAGLFLAIVTNASPWTYLGSRPVTPTPAASFDAGLDLYGLTSLGTLSTLHQVRQLLTTPGRPPRGRSVFSLHDEADMVIRASRPVAFQVDGEYLGPVESIRLRSFPGALRLAL